MGPRTMVVQARTRLQKMALSHSRIVILLGRLSRLHPRRAGSNHAGPRAPRPADHRSP